jgi:creatinine amidohydrolase/Fe(II)-dependent formamide hydrolase-like protein
LTVNLGRIRPATSPETKFSRQIDALDRERTMFILPIGMLEEHGPHLPIGADTFGVMFEADGVAKRISRPLQRWNVLMMPPLHYGKLRANAGQTFDELQELATKPAWQGYMSAPAKVTAAYGRDIEGWWVDGLSELILRAAAGENLL